MIWNSDRPSMYSNVQPISCAMCICCTNHMPPSGVSCGFTVPNKAERYVALETATKSLLGCVQHRLDRKAEIFQFQIQPCLAIRWRPLK